MDTRQIRDEIAMARGTLQRLEASLAVTEKPKLRHGEMRIWRKEVSDTMTEDLPVIVDLSCRPPRILFRGSNGESLRVEYSEEKILRLSNHVSDAFADLTALSEDVEEVEMQCSCFEGDKWTVRLTDRGEVVFDDPRGDSIHMTADQFRNHILKLRQMAATAARKSGKQD